MTAPRVFIADYDEESLRHLEGVVRAAGFEVSSSKTGTGSLDLIASFQPRVCIIDPMISGIDGFELCRRIREEYPHVATIISTGIYKGERYQQDAVSRYGVTAYLEKPYSDEMLVRILHELVDRVGDFEKQMKQQEAPPAVDTVDLDATIGAEPDALEETLLDPAQEQPVGGAGPSLDFDQAEAFPESSAESERSLLDALNQLDTYNQGEGKKTAKPKAPPDAPKTSAQEPVSTMKLSTNDIFGGIIQEVEAQSFTPAKTAEDIAPVEAEEALPQAAFSQPTVADSAANLAAEPEPTADLHQPDPEPEWDTAPNLAGEEEHDTNPAHEAPADLPGAGLDAFETEDVPKGGPPTPRDLKAPAFAELPPAEGEYEFIEKLGEDAMSEFWKAKRLGERGFETIVTIQKVHEELEADPTFQGLFAEESKAVVNLNHPNIAHIHEIATIAGHTTIAREYLDGAKWETVLDRASAAGNPIPFPVIGKLGLLICQALQYAHQQKGIDGLALKLSHGNLNPTKIFIDRDGEVKIIGFGLHGAQAHARVMLGRPDARDDRFMPSAHAFGQGTDLYSLGAILFYSVTGLVPNAEAPQPPHAFNPAVPELLSQAVFTAMQSSENPEMIGDVMGLLDSYLDSETEIVDNQRMAETVANLLKGKPAPDPIAAEESRDMAQNPVFDTLPPGITVDQTKADSSVDFGDEPAELPQAVPLEPPAPAAGPLGQQVKAAPPQKKPSGASSRMPLIILLLVVVVAAAGAAWFLMNRGEAGPTPPPPANMAVEQPEAPAPEPEMSTPDPLPPTEETVENPAPTDPPPSEEPSELDAQLEKLRKEMEAKREALRKLEEEQKKNDQEKKEDTGDGSGNPNP